MDYIKAYQSWLEKVDDKSLKAELDGLTDQSDIENRFYKELEFGTGGLRGILGAGTNYLNIYTIRKATQGLCNYIRKTGGKSVAVSYDSRINSRLFAENAAMVLAESGIKVYIADRLMPTPFLSFAVRELSTDAGIMITASHNPAKYNGYKVYGSDGCQITDSAAASIIAEISEIDAFSVKVKPLQSYIDSGDIVYMPNSVRESFIEKVMAQKINPESDLSVMYTPLNGAGCEIVPEVLKRCGFNDVKIVREQGMPDGNFATCPYPNPEKYEALKLGLEYAERNNSDILIATDPDADRVGTAVKTQDGYKLITGNEMGVLLADYILKCRSEKGTLPKNPIVIKTIVTTSMASSVAEKYGAEIRDVLTGFKYIGEQITLLEKAGEENRFVLGFEESYGYLAGTHVRDKDAVVASMLIAEMAAYYKKQGKTLSDVLEALYQTYGKYSHRLISKEFAGAAGSKKMEQLLSKLRQAKPDSIAGLKVVKRTDYLTQTERDLPKANVLVYDLQKNAQLIVRPSGTEPLIKFYLTSALTDRENEKVFSGLTSFVDEFFI